MAWGLPAEILRGKLRFDEVPSLAKKCVWEFGKSRVSAGLKSGHYTVEAERR